jgi:CheY-like chemotaxis protein
MAQRFFIKVVGFSDEERHALNTVFRLSEQCSTMYQLWTPEVAEPPHMALLDGDSYEAPVEAESPTSDGLRMLWIGTHPPANIWRTLDRPMSWHQVIEAMDSVFSPADPLDLDLVAPEPEIMSEKLALIVSPDRAERLYLRARLSLSKLTLADEAESGLQAMELARIKQYDLALVTCELHDMTPWSLLRQLRAGRKPIRHVAMTKARRSMSERMRAWLGGAEAMLDQPPHPGRFNDWLSRI